MKKKQQIILSYGLVGGGLEVKDAPMSTVGDDGKVPHPGMVEKKRSFSNVLTSGSVQGDVKKRRVVRSDHQEQEPQEGTG